MPDKSHNPTQFWQELKRRKVFRVIAMYAATAFIILEAVDIVFPRWGLPDWSVNLVILLLILGFMVTAILAWIFDITPEGIQKTESASLEKDMTLEMPDRRRLKGSDAIIVVLLVVVCILLYPKIFKQDKFEDIRDTDGRISVAVMPFQNLSGDTLFNIWQEGIQNLLITSLSNSEELSVRQYKTMSSIFGDKKSINYSSLTPTFASDIALKLDANTVIVGNIYKSGNIVRITANLLDSKSEEIYKSYEIDGVSENDFFPIIDSLSALVKNFLEIKILDHSMFFDLSNTVTKSTTAYKHYIQGSTYHSKLDYDSAIEFYTKALSIDSNFISPMLKLSYVYADIGQSQLSKKWAYKAFSKINNVPFDIQLSIREVKAVVDKRPMDQIGYMEQYLKINPYCLNKLYGIGWACFSTEQWNKAIDAFERNVELNRKLDRKSWIWTYILLGKAYHEIGEHNKERKIYEFGLILFPNDKCRIIHLQAICALSQGDTIMANEYLAEFTKIAGQDGLAESIILYWLAGAHDQVNNLEQAEKLYRQALAINPQFSGLINDFANFLISNDINIDEGIELINGVIENTSENGNYLYTYGLGLYKKGILIEAQEVLKMAWDLRPYYNHDHYLLIREVEQALASQNQ